MKACVTRASGSIDQIKACYIGMKAYPDSKLVEMMVTDACFILAFIYNYCGKPDSSLGQNVLLYPHIFLDMNQDRDSSIVPKNQDRDSSTVPKNQDRDSSTVPLWQDGDLSRAPKKQDGDSSTVPKMGKRPMVLCFPKSWVKPTFKMPVLRIHDHSELFIRNLIIYEHSSEVQTCVTSYMNALDFLIDTPENVAKMVKSQVLVNYLGSDEEAAGMINNICKEVPIGDFYYKDEWKVLDEYYKAYWPNIIIAGLRHKYFGNPWSIIALIAGVVLFILTVIQTSYTVKAA
uniref:Uncharacterized protein n=1 Tax=Tanacetum cinerariifolium TaxID=118510 RepID=A0A6L2NHA7_TANCI|nr:uncharacterized protein [Tanacetum cinerariifolium]